MRKFIARRMLRAFSKRYGYDTSYTEMVLKESPSAFFKLAPLMKASAHREVVPVEASFAAKITGALAEDCGPCTQLCIDMALEAGMAKDQIEAVLRRSPRAMTPEVLLGFQFATMFMDAFDRIGDREKMIHVISLLLVAVTILLLMTPAAYHRIAERRENTESFERSRYIVTASLDISNLLRRSHLHISSSRLIDSGAI